MKELQEKLRSLDSEIEQTLEMARELEAQGKELPKGFWDHIDNCVDELNSARVALMRGK